MRPVSRLLSSWFPGSLRRYFAPAVVISVAVLGMGCSTEPHSKQFTPPSATSRLFPADTLPTLAPTRFSSNYGGHYFSSTDPEKLVIYMREPSQEEAEAVALQLVGQERFDELTEVQALPGYFPLRLRRIWVDQLWGDAPNIKDILIRYRITGSEYGMFEFQNTSHHDRIIARVNLQENMELFMRVVRNRMVLLGIPQGAVEFDLVLIATPAAR